MENKVLIFGDSYADPKGCPSYAWHNRLKDKYSKTHEFHNYGETGTGSQYAFEHFYDKLEKLKKDDILIFLLADSFRINFFDGSLFQNGELSHIVWDEKSKKSYCVFDKDPKNLLSKKDIRLLEYYKKYEKEIDFLYNTYEKELFYFNAKNISFLHTISKNYNLKVIVFEICSSSSSIIKRARRRSKLEERNFTLQQRLKTGQSDDNFHLFGQFLSELSQNEIYKEELHLFNDSLRRGDKRSNHFSEENHNILYDYIEHVLRSFDMNAFEKRHDILYKYKPKFKQHFKHCADVYNMMDTKVDKLKGKFIYE